MRDWGRTHNDKRSVRRVDCFGVEIGSVKSGLGAKKANSKGFFSWGFSRKPEKIAQVVLGKTEITQKHDFTQ